MRRLSESSKIPERSEVHGHTEDQARSCPFKSRDQTGPLGQGLSSGTSTQPMCCAFHCPSFSAIGHLKWRTAATDDLTAVDSSPTEADSEATVSTVPVASGEIRRRSILADIQRSLQNGVQSCLYRRSSVQSPAIPGRRLDLTLRESVVEAAHSSSVRRRRRSKDEEAVRAARALSLARVGGAAASIGMGIICAREPRHVGDARVKTTLQKTRFRSVNSTRNSRTGQN